MSVESIGDTRVTDPNLHRVYRLVARGRLRIGYVMHGWCASVSQAELSPRQLADGSYARAGCMRNDDEGWMREC